MASILKECCTQIGKIKLDPVYTDNRKDKHELYIKDFTLDQILINRYKQYLHPPLRYLNDTFENHFNNILKLKKERV